MLDEDVARLRKQVKAFHRRLQRDLPISNGLSLTTLHILATLDRAATAMRPGEIATELQMTDSNVAAALRSLESQNLVLRRSDPADGRKAFIDITDLGRSVADQTRRSYYAKLSRAIESSLTEQEQSLLLQAGMLMQRLADQGSQHQADTPAARSHRRRGVAKAAHATPSDL
ncbi:MarR family transcriptional regulator [Novosphingobium sp. SG707]|uniref:MarR family winged helix-turn-helix transcriptional regulator n=1 Tax=Novosphingobium sp. SG707 TaxID=2586996 RepID=UPI001445C9D7|nr:MarR family transcriptional regulator [Novosphingobium sp. SG707]NKJ00953.1 DNA-binding MarR family transcriptional regulator [Novosphingobium sp. SG707]